MTTWIMSDEMPTDGEGVRRWMKALGARVIEASTGDHLEGMGEKEFRQYLSQHHKVELLAKMDQSQQNIRKAERYTP